MKNYEPYSLDEAVTDDADDQMTLNDVMSVDTADPSIEAARNMDWAAFMEG